MPLFSSSSQVSPSPFPPPSPSQLLSPWPPGETANIQRGSFILRTCLSVWYEASVGCAGRATVKCTCSGSILVEPCEGLCKRAGFILCRLGVTGTFALCKTSHFYLLYLMRRGFELSGTWAVFSAPGSWTWRWPGPLYKVCFPGLLLFLGICSFSEDFCLELLLAVILYVCYCRKVLTYGMYEKDTCWGAPGCLWWLMLSTAFSV